MNQVREKVSSLYESGDLLGFSVCGDTGEVIHNESFFSDEYAWQATAPFVRVARKLLDSGRDVNRLTVELDDVALVYGVIEQGHALFTLAKDCDLDAVAGVLS